MLPAWKGKPILPSRSAQDEMFDLDIGLGDVVEVLEDGFDCSRSRRRKGTFERCVRRGKDILKIVVVDTGRHLVLTHAGRVTASKRKLQQLKRR